MTSQELFDTISKLREEHGKEFERWYDTANYPAIENYCEIGFLVSRYWPTEE